MMEIDKDYDWYGTSGAPKTRIPEEYNWYSPATPPAAGAEDTGTWSYGGEDITGNITLPENWTTATDYLKGLLGGDYSIGGGGSDAWGMAKARAQQMLGTGEPVDISGWWEAQKPVYAQSYEDQMRQMAEEAGLGGMRWSSPLQRNIADMIRRGETQLTAEAMTKQLSAEEAAKQRVLETMGVLGQIGAGESQAGMAGAANKMAAIQSLLGAGQSEAELSMNLANQLAGMGTGLYGMEQSQYEDIYNPPWMQYGTQLAGQAAQGRPQTYQPSIWENLAGAASYLPGLLKPTTLGQTAAPQGRTFTNLPYYEPEPMYYGG